MARSGSIYHDSDLVAEAAGLGCWARIGENVGMGPSVGAIHQALMNSPSHRANLLGDFDALGVGVEIAPDGRIYVTQRFLKSCGTGAPAPVPAPAPAPVVQPAAAPVQPAPAPRPAPVHSPSVVSTAAAPAPPTLEPSRGVEQERPGGHLVYDHCFLKWYQGVLCTSKGLSRRSHKASGDRVSPGRRTLTGSLRGWPYRIGAWWKSFG